MKNNILFKYLMSFAIILGVTSCEDRELININSETAPVVMDLSAETLVLSETFPDNPALTVSWEPATFNVPVEVKYEVEISSTEDFAEPQTLGSTAQSVTYLYFTHEEMNEAVKTIGLEPYVAQDVYFRVKSFVGEDSLPSYSNVTTLNVTPYLASPTYNYTDLYLVGNATAAGWDNLATNDNMYPLLKTSDNTVYTYTGFFKGGTDIGFKVVQVKGSWDAQYGQGSSVGTLSTDGGSSDFKVSADGYYTFTMNTASLTYTFVEAAAPTTTYDAISIIGSVRGDWNEDIELTQSTFDPHVWYIMGVELNGGAFKFRANKAWDVSWGTNSEFYGVAAQGGADIPLSAQWTYNVYFNDATGAYSVIPVK